MIKFDKSNISKFKRGLTLAYPKGTNVPYISFAEVSFKIKN